MVLRFQLFLQFIQVAPIGTLWDQLVRMSFYHAYFMKSEGVKAQRTFCARFAPAGVGWLSQDFQPDVITWLIAFIHHHARGTLRFLRTYFGGLDKRAPRSFCRDWMSCSKTTISEHYATKLLAPRTVWRGIEDDMSDFLRV